MTAPQRLAGLTLLLALLAIRPLLAQDDVADVKSQDLCVDNDEHKRFFLIGPGENERSPANGFGLIVVLPGGDGSADFHPFVKRIFKYAAPKGFLLAEPVAVKWTKDQEITWPTANTKTAGMKFTTEEFVGAVIDDTQKRYQIDPKQVFTLSWSSGGPAAYVISTSQRKVTGSFIAMSVFCPADLTLAGAKGQAYYLYHSPGDGVCPFRMSQEAEKTLETAGAKVKLVHYDGGHGWHGNVFGDIRDGLQWLQKANAD